MMLNRTPAAQWKRRARTHLTVLCAIGTALVSACGGDSDRATPTAPSPSSAPAALSRDQLAAALRLYESASGACFFDGIPARLCGFASR